jgi:Zn-dependent protease with chaperone function
MNFWSRQDATRQKSKILFVCFFVVLACCALLPYFCIYSGVSLFKHITSEEIQSLKITLLDGLKLWKQPVFYISALIMGLPIIGGAILQFSRLVSDSGKVIAEMLNGYAIPSHTEDFYQRRLLNIVDEMSIASGVPIPRVYILNDEPGINALVAGKTSHNAVLCVTRGACELLKRDELQGVIAHEYSHLLNGDMAFHTLMLGLLHGFFLSVKTSKKLDIAESGSGVLWKDLLFLVVQLISFILLLPIWLWLYGMILGTIGKIMKASFSRTREYLADACAVQFTRYPKGLADAMKTIGALPRWQVIRRANHLELSHFFFTDGTPPPLMFSIYPSHPPLKKRIKLLDADFNGNFPAINRGELKKKIYTLKDKMHHTDDILAAGLLMHCDIPRKLRIDSLCNSFGTFSKNDIEQTSNILRQIPPLLHDMTKKSEQATALIYALLTERENKKLRKVQLDLLREQCSLDVMTGHANASALLNETTYYHMILVELSMPALRTLSVKEYDAFRTICRHLVLMDDCLTLYEYAVTTCLRSMLDPFFGFAKKQKEAETIPSQQKIPEFEMILSIMAWCGSDNETEARKAFDAGVKTLPGQAIKMELKSLKPFDPDLMTISIREICRQSLQRKKSILDACMTTIGADMVIKPVEWNILRAFAMMLDCPLPLLPPDLKT